VVYTSRSTVTNYLALWRDVCLGEKPDENIPIAPRELDGKMPAVKARAGTGGADTSRLEVARGTAMPMKSGRAAAAEAEAVSSAAADDAKMTVPVVLEDVPEEYFATITGRGAPERKQQRIRELLRAACPDHVFNTYLASYRSLGVETPGTTGAIRRKILAPISAQQEGRKYILDVHAEDRGDNVWLAKMDPADKRVIIMVYHGAGAPRRRIRFVVEEEMEEPSRAAAAGGAGARADDE
jgi:hypothetical protein